MKAFLIAFGAIILFVALGLAGWWVLQDGFVKTGPKRMIEATIRLDNKCSVADDVFIVSAPKLGRVKAFHKGVAVMKLPEGTKVQLAASPSYPDVAYDGILETVEPVMTLTADCSLSPRMEGIFSSMKKAFAD